MLPRSPQPGTEAPLTLPLEDLGIPALALAFGFPEIAGPLPVYRSQRRWDLWRTQPARHRPRSTPMACHTCSAAQMDVRFVNLELHYNFLVVQKCPLLMNCRDASKDMAQSHGDMGKKEGRLYAVNWSFCPRISI